MSASFARELFNREVVGSGGESLGVVKDVNLDLVTGSINEIHVRCHASIDPTKLPWPSDSDVVRLPIDVIGRIAERIHLNVQ